MNPSASRTDAGFTLIETLIAMLVLAGGFLALAQAFALGLTSISSGTPHLIAREKAAEAIEGIYAARDSQLLDWDDLQNASSGGVFLDDARSLTEAGADSLVNTADDGDIETIAMPGADGELGTEDDEAQPLAQFTREIEITGVSANLRRLRVIIRYQAGGSQEYVLETLISAFA
jgi:prepilin-type N-terminal cleavage/methylation domain-containing protein